MENGNVVQFLHERAPDADCILLVSRVIKIWHHRTGIMGLLFQSLDIAQGLEYLHSKNIIHGDLKGVSLLMQMSLPTSPNFAFQVNILVSPSGRACLADFGLATTMESKPGSTSMNRTAGTLRWQAPELFPDMDSDAENIQHRNTFATDVYAYGLVCYEASQILRFVLRITSEFALDVLRYLPIP